MQNKLKKHKDKIIIGIILLASIGVTLYIMYGIFFSQILEEEVNFNSEVEIINKNFK